MSTPSATEDLLRSLGLSSESREALCPEMRSAIERFLEGAARELCAGQVLPGITGVAVNLLGERTQLNAAFAGPLPAVAGQSGLLEGMRVLPLSATVCAHVVASDDGYLDLSDPEPRKRDILMHLIATSGGALQAYLGAAVEVDGVRVGTLCIYGTEPAGPGEQSAREVPMRRYGALLSAQLAEAHRLRAENAGMRADLRGVAPSEIGDGAIHRSREEAAAWRETVAILGDVERAVGGAGDAGHGAAVVACVIELRPSSGTVAVVATSEAAVDRHGMRPCVLRRVGDDDLVGYWRAALAAPVQPSPDTARPPHIHHDDALVTAAAPARLGTPPGAFASVTAHALPAAHGTTEVLRGLVVLCGRAPSGDGERGVRGALVGHFAGIVAEAQHAALSVYLTPSLEPPAAPTDEETVHREVLASVRRAFGAMRLRGLLALAEERGVPGADDAESTEELLRLIAAHASTLARSRRAHLQTLSVRELLSIGAASGIEKVEAAESKREMVAAILEAEGIFPSSVPASAPLRPLPVPPRTERLLTAEQAVVKFDPNARWLREATEREHESLPYAPPRDWKVEGFPRPPVPPDESARNTAFDRLGVAEMRDWSGEELATFDGIAAAVAAVAGSPSAALTLIHRTEHILIGLNPRAVGPLLLGDAPAGPRATSFCQYGVAKGAALAVADTHAPDAGPLGTIVSKDTELKGGFGVLPRAYLGVPMVTAEGVVLGNVCAIDDKPRPDFVSSRLLVEQMSALAAAAVNLFELRRLRNENAELHARRTLNVAAVEPLSRLAGGTLPPTDRVALLMTDIEGSTALHERDSALMKHALDVHDAVMRRAVADNGGIEITTEGDSFIVAFHTAADAIRCCFDAQLRLLSAPWPAGLDDLGAPARTDDAQPFRGLRVRMTVHFAEAGGGLLGARSFEVSRHEVTRRPQYRGHVVDVCRFFSEMPSGGQVLVTQQAFDEVSLALTAALGDPQVIDLGRYEDGALGDVGHAYQLLPQALATRCFDPPLRVPRGGRLTAPGYIHAPRTSPLVIVFALPVGLTGLRLRSDAAYARGLEAFAESVRSALSAHGGYEMKENDGAFMCAFAHTHARAALAFGADVHARLAVTTGKVLRCRIGMHGGDVTVEPHPSTGRMDAVGPACNRAARLAKAANPGQTLVDAATAAPAADAMPLYDLGEHGFRGLDDTVRVVQVGEGFFPPIQSQSYANDLHDFDYSPMNLLARARASLGLLDAFGVESLPSGLRRPQIEAALATAVAARETHQASTRLVPGRKQREE